jgi:hypothetical protein
LQTGALIFSDDSPEPEALASLGVAWNGITENVSLLHVWLPTF